MNVNIIIDPEYIISNLKKDTDILRVAHLFLTLKNKSNIIIIQDKDKDIIKQIQKKFASCEFESGETQRARVFMFEIYKGTNNLDFVTQVEFNNDLDKFIDNMQDNYPFDIIITNKIQDQNKNVKTFKVEEADKISELLEEKSKKHYVSNNKNTINLNNDKKNKTKVLNFEQYKDILFKTFWCSNEITLIAKEFYDAYKGKNSDLNMSEYKLGFKYLLECLEPICSIHKKKVNILLITGEKHRYKERVNKKDTDFLKSYLESINNNFLFNIKVIKWDAGTERHTGLAHGRKIYSDYGGFDTEYAPYEFYKKDQKKNEYYFKDTAFTWMDKKNSFEWSKIGPILQET
ncbi:hypothetical protein N9V41_03135 [Candidatus Pelagibacter bacterium]|nr:hypothetical protein [Candidatus Pelagibacter bacterium]